jgi:hypothetical protein
MQRLAGFLRTYWTRGEPGRPTPRSLAVLMQRWWLVALAFKLLGSSWDVAWHFKWLRDDFAPPHLVNTVGTGIAIALVLAHTFTGYGADRVSLRIMQIGTVVFVIAGPIDVINHRVNGLDLTSWSPSHLLLYTGTVIMIAGVIRNWYLHHPRDGRFAWQWTAGLVALSTFLFEDVFFPNLQQEYGILEIASWFRGSPYAEPTLLDFASTQIGRGVDDVAVQHFALPIPAWVYPVWTIGLCAALLVFARILVGRRWTASVVVGLYVGYRLLIWPLLVLTGFPPSSVPFWLLLLGFAVDAVFLVRVPAYLRAVLAAVAVTGAGALGLLLQAVLAGSPLDLAAQSIQQLRATFEAGGKLHTPPVGWGSLWWAGGALLVTALAATWVADRTVGLSGPRPPALAAAYAPEPRRNALGHLDGWSETGRDAVGRPLRPSRPAPRRASAARGVGEVRRAGSRRRQGTTKPGS